MSDRTLRAALIRVAYTNPSILAADEEDAGSTKGRPGAKMMQFLEDHGEEKVVNPDTNNRVKIKSLKGENLQREFQRWLKQVEREEAAAKKKSPAGKKEKDEGSTDEQDKALQKKVQALIDKEGPEGAHKLLGLPGKPPKSDKLDERIQDFVKQHGVDALRKRVNKAAKNAGLAT